MLIDLVEQVLAGLGKGDLDGSRIAFGPPSRDESQAFESIAQSTRVGVIDSQRRRQGADGLAAMVREQHECTVLRQRDLDRRRGDGSHGRSDERSARGDEGVGKFLAIGHGPLPLVSARRTRLPLDGSIAYMRRRIHPTTGRGSIKGYSFIST